MADFTSEFWNWFIIVPTLLGIVGLYLLTRHYAKGSPSTIEEAEELDHVWDENLRELSNPLPRWWLIMFYITLVFGVVYLLLYPGLGKFGGLLGWTQIGQYQDEVQSANDRYGPLFAKYLQEDIAKLSSNDTAMRSARRLFANYCSVCHGSDAQGAKSFPNLTDNTWLWGGSPGNIKDSILKGRNSIMPPWKAALGPDGVFNMSEYVLSLSGRKVNTNAAAQGKQKFQQLCIACHGKDGTGNYALGAPDLTDNKWLHGGSQDDIIETISEGRQNQMPPHQEFLGEAKSHLLAAYVYGLSNK